MKTSDRKLGSGHSGPEVIFIDRDEPRLRAAEERIGASAARAYQAIILIAIQYHCLTPPATWWYVQKYLSMSPIRRSFWSVYWPLSWMTCEPGMEDLRESPQRGLSRCFRHLGVDQIFVIDEGIRLNEGSSKFYDSRVLRYLRTHRWFGPRLARLSPEAQDRILAPIGLRRPFTDPVKWDARAIEQVKDEVLPDARAFLQAYGKPADFWDMTFPS